MSNRNNKLHSLFTAVQRPLLVLLTTIAPVMTQYAHAGTLGGSTSFSGAWGWTFSYEIMQFTRANITLEDGTIIAAPTFDITEDRDSFTTHADGTTTGTGSALFTGVLKVTHGPEEIEIIIDPEPVTATYSDGNSFTFLKESRIYKVILNTPPETNENKLTDGFKRVVPELPHTGVYDICDGTNTSHLCYQEIGYGKSAFNPSDIFQPTTAASGLPVGADTGFYWDEVCLAFLPGNLNVNVDGQDYTLKEDDDGYFRSCEGRSVVFNACTRKPDPDPYDSFIPEFNCNDTNEDEAYFTLSLLDAAAGDRLEPAPATTCIGTNVDDWLGLEAYAGSGEDVVITPCDPNQGYILFPYMFSDSHIAFTSSEGDNAVIDGLQIISIGTRNEIGTAVVLEESADKTNSYYDFSKILLNNVTYISSLELDDIVTGSANSDVILGGNGNDWLYGFSGNDCLDGQQNDDHLFGDGHANADADQGSRGADVFVLTSKLGKETIHDFSEDDDDMIVNTTNTEAVVTANPDGTYNVALKGQNFATVHVLDGTLEKGVNVIDAPEGLSAYDACKGHPLY
jgi:hypothetical protein